MAYNFPNSPSNGDTVTVNNVTYTYNSTLGAWKTTASSVGELNDLTDVSASAGTDGQVLTVQSDGTFAFEDASGGGGGGASVTTSDTAPSSPSAGDLWWNSSDGKLYIYYTDVDSSQWVSVSVAGATGSAGSGGGVTTYSSYSAFPSASEASEGDLAFASDTGALYVFDGSEWDRMAAGSDETPVITTEPASSHSLNTDGSTSTVTMVAEDPEGFDIEYGIVYKTSESRGLGSNGLPVQITGTSINQSTGVYTFTPSTTSGDAGDFTARLSASDGVKMTSRTVAIDLTFPPIIELLLIAGGGGGNYSAGGGGGAGGLVHNTSYATTGGTTYNIVVGGGGAKSTVQGDRGTAGSDSTFTAGSTLVYTATGGGGGGPYPATGSGDGGSGAGAGRATSGDEGSSTQASYSGLGFGNAGGSPFSNEGAGGGGGAGGAGGNGSATVGGAGGAGKAISITGSSVNYAPGGPGGGYDVTQGSYTTGSGSSYGAGGAGGIYNTNTQTDGTAGVCIIAVTSTPSSVTGTYTLDTSSRSGYNVYTFTGNGTITF